MDPTHRPSLSRAAAATSSRASPRSSHLAKKTVVGGTTNVNDVIVLDADSDSPADSDSQPSPPPPISDGDASVEDAFVSAQSSPGSTLDERPTQHDESVVFLGSTPPNTISGEAHGLVDALPSTSATRPKRKSHTRNEAENSLATAAMREHSQISEDEAYARQLQAEFNEQHERENDRVRAMVERYVLARLARPPPDGVASSTARAISDDDEDYLMPQSDRPSATRRVEYSEAESGVGRTPRPVMGPPANGVGRGVFQLRPAAFGRGRPPANSTARERPLPGFAGAGVFGTFAAPVAASGSDEVMPQELSAWENDVEPMEESAPLRRPLREPLTRRVQGGFDTPITLASGENGEEERRQMRPTTEAQRAHRLTSAQPRGTSGGFRTRAHVREAPELDAVTANGEVAPLFRATVARRDETTRQSALNEEERVRRQRVRERGRRVVDEEVVPFSQQAERTLDEEASNFGRTRRSRDAPTTTRQERSAHTFEGAAEGPSRGQNARTGRMDGDGAGRRTRATQGGGHRRFFDELFFVGGHTRGEDTGGREMQAIRRSQITEMLQRGRFANFLDDSANYEALIELAEAMGDGHEALSAVQLRRFPICEYTVPVLGEEAAAAPAAEEGSFNDPTCRICYDEYEVGNEQRVMPCFHRFHKECIDTWLKRKVTCPLCRIDVRKYTRDEDGAAAKAAAIEGDESD